MSTTESMNTPFGIDSITQAQSIDSNGDVVQVYKVRWHSPGLGNFTTELPEKDFTPQEAASIIQEKANQLSAFHSTVKEMHSNLNTGG